MGLTGFITEATIKLTKVQTAYVNVEEKRAKDLDELLSDLLEFNRKYLYTVAWIDFSGKFRGRGIVSGADHADLEKMPKQLAQSTLKPLHQRRLTLPYPFRFGIINRFSIRIFNSIWYYKPLGKNLQHIQKYMHPLDDIQNWNVVYGKEGFIQYQFVVPFDRTEAIRQIVQVLKNNRLGSFLTVLKSFGVPSKGMLGFPIEGWTLAIDFPKNKSNLNDILIELDEIVLDSSGRIYLTKDSRLDSTYLPAMYHNLDIWKSVKREVDPENFWQSDQGRRLKLC
jgi:decaprenylphospho-beta-D-ribofuranose 2-oxidase